MTSNKMGFGAVLALVFGSQIGSGIFVLPSNLAPFGWLGIFGWCFAGIGALLLAFVFAGLCSQIPKTGGPHAYVQAVFGRLAGFFVGWTYWLVSWVSSTVVVITAVACLQNFFPEKYTLLFEIILLLLLAYINCKSVTLSGKIELVLTLLKFVPFVLVPLVLIPHFNVRNIQMLPTELPLWRLLGGVTALSFWGFIGVECATAPAEAVRNPTKTIPRAIVVGTFCVAIIYFMNNLMIMGTIPCDVLANTSAPYTQVISIIGGKHAALAMGIITAIVCIGTLNAWILTSAQISLGLAQDQLLPSIFAKKNRQNAPYVSVLICCLGMIPILVLTQSESLSEQIFTIISFSEKSFLLVYTACCLAYLKLAKKNGRKRALLLGIVSLMFCIFFIFESSVKSILAALLFSLLGVFVLPFIKKTN